MCIDEDLITYANSLFDVVGVTLDVGTDNKILLLGLVTTPDRDLDEFVHEGNRTIMKGFINHAKNKEDSLIDFIKDKGFQAELVGKLGYAPSGKPNLKQLAVSAGLGKQGKNTLVINPRFGPWLRFMAVKTNAHVRSTGPGMYSKSENPYCENCQDCIVACPVNILMPYRLDATNRCLAAVSEDRKGSLAICDRCMVVCPVGERKSRLG